MAAPVQFESRLNRALERVRVTLGSEKSCAFASQVHHKYQDKYLLAEIMTNMAAASQLNCLCSLGIAPEAVEQMKQWSRTSAVSLRFRSQECCTFDREETREVEAPTKHVDEVSVGGMVRAAWTSKVVNTITEYFWKYEASYEILAVRGVGAEPSDCVSILSRVGRDELKTATKAPPHGSLVPTDQDVNVSWLFRHLEAGTTAPAFRVDRSHKSCHTPRRNPDVEAALEHFRNFMSWVDPVTAWLKKMLRVQPDPTKKLDVSAVDANDSILVPVLPLLEDEVGAPLAVDSAAEADAAPGFAPPQHAGAGVLASLPMDSTADGAATQVISSAALNQLLAEELRALNERRTSLGQSFPQGTMVASMAEASLIVLLKHCQDVCRQWSQAVDYIESLLRSQLIAAIGKEVSPADFAEYMRFHSRKIFAEAYMPAPFCFAVRRSDQHTPEGTVSIEEEVVGPGGDSNIAAPIVTMCSKNGNPEVMQFALNASTNVSFSGSRFLHAWLSHQFSGHSGAKLSLVAKTRQFSSMLILVGRITSATTFHPKYAAILQNKDELTIPLDLSTIPTPKEFKDAIESLSPEQQEFAKAFRAMQLESTLFGILVIHIKPQLEKVLNLPEDSLTKEIKLTQDLMQLFVKYQIPSDLLSFDACTGTDGMEVVDATAAERVTAVKAHVSAMNSMIEEAKKEEIRERQMERSYVRQERSVPQPGAMLLGFGSAMPPQPAFQGMSMSMGQAMPMAWGASAPPMAMALSAPPVAMAAMAPMAPSAPPMAMAQQCAMGIPTPECAMPMAPRAMPMAGLVQGAVPVQPPSAQQTAPPRHEEPPLPTSAGARDYTKVPREMDERFEELDTDGALRPTIISPGEHWTKKAQKALLASPTTTGLGSEEQKSEKSAAFDLLDALTKSGATPIEHASLHVVVAATQCFDKTVTETVVQDNINPIEKVERSMLIMASTVHQQPAAALVQGSQLPRLKDASPSLFLSDEVVG